MQKIRKIVLVALLAVLMSSIAYSIIKYTTTITNTASIIGYEIKLWRSDTGIAVESISWGNLDKNSAKDTEQVFNFSQQLKLKNTGDYITCVSWKLDPATPLPANVTLTAAFENGGWNIWNPLVTDALGPIPIGSFYDYPVNFILTIGDAARGPVNFGIILSAQSTGAG